MKFDKDGKMIKQIAVVSIDMDDLKIINDTYGHNAGDDAIKETAQCIDESLNKGEFVARMGGDEFEAVLVLSEPFLTLTSRDWKSSTTDSAHISRHSFRTIPMLREQ